MCHDSSLVSEAWDDPDFAVAFKYAVVTPAMYNLMKRGTMPSEVVVVEESSVFCKHIEDLLKLTQKQEQSVAGPSGVTVPPPVIAPTPVTVGPSEVTAQSPLGTTPPVAVLTENDNDVEEAPDVIQEAMLQEMPFSEEPADQFNSGTLPIRPRRSNPPICETVYPPLPWRPQLTNSTNLALWQMGHCLADGGTDGIVSCTASRCVCGKNLRANQYILIDCANLPVDVLIKNHMQDGRLANALLKNFTPILHNFSIGPSVNTMALFPEVEYCCGHVCPPNSHTLCVVSRYENRGPLKSRAAATEELRWSPQKIWIHGEASVHFRAQRRIIEDKHASLKFPLFQSAVQSYLLGEPVEPTGNIRVARFEGAGLVRKMLHTLFFSGGCLSDREVAYYDCRAMATDDEPTLSAAGAPDSMVPPPDYDILTDNEFNAEKESRALAHKMVDSKLDGPRAVLIHKQIAHVCYKTHDVPSELANKIARVAVEHAVRTADSTTTWAENLDYQIGSSNWANPRFGERSPPVATTNNYFL